MSAAELISRLNAKPNQLDAIPGQNSNAITSHDIAGAIGLAKLPFGPEYVIRIKFANQEYRPELRISLRNRLNTEYDLSKLLKRHIASQTVIGQICHESIEDFIDSNTCNTCKGTKHRMDGSLKITCLSCGGTGIRSEKRRQRFQNIAEKYDIPWRSFQRYWWPIIKVNYDILGRWERVGLASMKLLG